MKVYQDLKLFLKDIVKEQIIEKIDALLPGIWVRDIEQENVLTEKFHDEKQYAYSTVNNHNLPDARLWLASDDKGRLFVSNIVPIEVGQLTRDEYNAILNAFVDIIKKDDSIVYELTKSDIELEDFLPEEIALKLKRFSNLANKSTGYGHPCDFERWLDFVISFHVERCDRKYDLVERWLHEEAGWMWETASKLSSQLEYSLDVLSYYDRVK